MKKLLIVIGGFVVLVIAALLIAPMVIPVDTYKKEILAQVEKATGREARIDGDFGISLFPTVKFTAGKFSLANAKGGQADKLVSLEQLNVQVAVLPLISGNVVIDSFVLDKPVINLEIDAQGRPNWVFTPAAGTDTAMPAQDSKAVAPAKAGEGSGGLGISGLQLGDVRLVDGRIAYSDAKTGVSHTVDGINMSISLPSMTSPMAAKGSLVWNKEKIDLVLGIDNPDAFLAGTQTGLNAAVAASTLKFDFKGRASSKPQMKASGSIDLDVPSVRKLAAWAGQPMDAPGTGFGPLKINGQIGVDGQKYSFTKAKLSLDAIQATGDIRFDGSGRVPYINAGLGTGMLDLNPYLPPEQQAPAGGKATPAGNAAPAGTGGNAQKPASQGWSTDPIDLSGLRAVDADIALNVAGLTMRKIRIGKSGVNVALKGGRLTTRLTEMALYGGNGTATITADGAAAVPAVTAKLDLSGLQANPALKDAIDMDKIEGTLNANMDVAMRGGSQRDMISALGGKGKIAFVNGAIRGINIAAMVRNAASAFLDSTAREQQKTDFAELSGTFSIVRGVLSNNDLSLLSPLLRVGGKGTVDMPNRSVNYRIEPKVVASTTGQGGGDASGIKVPVIVSGPWDNLSYKPDLAGVIDGIAKDPGKALEGLKKMIPGQGGSSGGGAASPKPEDVLKKLFGR